MIRLIRLVVAAVFVVGGVLAAPYLTKHIPQSWSWTSDIIVLAALASVTLLVLIALIIFPGKPKPQRKIRRASIDWIPETVPQESFVPDWEPLTAR